MPLSLPLPAGDAESLAEAIQTVAITPLRRETYWPIQEISALLPPSPLCALARFASNEEKKRELIIRRQWFGQNSPIWNVVDRTLDTRSL